MSQPNQDNQSNNSQQQGLPLLGEKLPKLEVQTTQGKMTLPDDYKGKWLVLFSHPADFTPVCTTEFYSFAQYAKEFKKFNTELIGLSIDQVYSHIKWVQWIEDNLDQKISFPIIADDMGQVAQKLGMVHPSLGTNTVRAVFVIDDAGIIRTIFYYPQEIGRNMSEILRTVKALQIADDKNMAVPANWPQNELIEAQGILPPPTDRQGANKRAKNKDCYDWWFCYQPMD